ncbi:hypothetical protein E8E11_007975 [Didymella keratinophila]|nr:hypothetical protein E8E11_007975 [Didymella keratinophila]
MAELNDTQRAFLASLPTFDPNSTSVHTASCHCGTIQYTITLSPPLSTQKVGSCNCTICTKNGYLFLYPRRQDVVIHKGENALKSYQFGEKQLLHTFCAECGSSVWHDPRLWMLGEEVPDLLGVNVRMIKGVKLEELDVVRFNGYANYPFIGESAHLQEATTR